jgi:hypothetical protein
MFELILRFVILFAAVAGVAYAITIGVRRTRERRLLEAKKAADEQLKALDVARDAGALSGEDYDQLTAEIYQACREKGIPIDGQGTTARGLGASTERKEK